MAKVLSEVMRQYQDEARQRVTWLLANFFGGRQRRMADALKVPQSQISRIVNGRLAASPAFLDAMTRLPGINPAWARAGTGQPTLPTTRGTLPVALAVLPGPPLEYLALLTGQRHPVAEALERETRYWLELQPFAPLLRDPSLKLLAGDLLLMEAAPEWTTNPDVIVGRLCGVRVRSGLPEASCQLGKLIQGPLGLALVAMEQLICQGEPTQPHDTAAGITPPPSQEGETEPQQKKVKRRRTIRPLENEKSKAEARRQAKEPSRPEGRMGGGATTPAQVTIEDIVGVCVYLARPAPGSGSGLPVAVG